MPSTKNSEVFRVIRWLDAFESSHQHTINDIPHAPLIVETCGWVLRDDEVGISVAGERIPGENPTNYRAVTFIPRSLIQAVVSPLAQSRKRAQTTPPPAVPSP